MHLACSNADKRGNIAVQIQQRVHLHGGLVLAESRPRKQRQAEVDCCRVESVQSLVQVHTDRVVAYNGRAMPIKTCAKSA